MLLLLNTLALEQISVAIAEYASFEHSITKQISNAIAEYKRLINTLTKQISVAVAEYVSLRA